jgi:predicted patatin/cPLA2 family phospholipase
MDEANTVETVESQIKLLFNEIETLFEMMDSLKKDENVQKKYSETKSEILNLENKLKTILTFKEEKKIHVKSPREL